MSTLNCLSSTVSLTIYTAISYPTGSLWPFFPCKVTRSEYCFHVAYHTAGLNGLMGYIDLVLREWECLVSVSHIGLGLFVGDNIPSGL